MLAKYPCKDWIPSCAGTRGIDGRDLLQPMPVAEHFHCPEGMSCFAYTPCNSARSFCCVTSFNEASMCEHRGSSPGCPNNLSYFSNTGWGMSLDSFYRGTFLCDTLEVDETPARAIRGQVSTKEGASPVGECQGP